MARQNSLLKINGTLAGMTFYKTKDGHLVKEKSAIKAEKIANDPAFQRTRENGKEFGNAGTSGKMLRSTVRALMASASDNLVTSRLTKLMTLILKLDSTSVRGDRNVGVGIQSPVAKAMLKNFDFNQNSVLGSVLFKSIDLDSATGETTISGLVPINELVAPTGATHFSMKSGFAKVDFSTGESALEISNTVNLPLNGISNDVVLSPSAVPAGTGTSIYLLLIEFFQEVNGVQYAMRNGTANVLTIIEVL